jgi:hypothetical protein
MAPKERAALLRGSSAQISAKFYFPQKAGRRFPRAACGEVLGKRLGPHQKPKSNFAEILAESYPFRGCPQQTVLYKGDTKRGWSRCDRTGKSSQCHLSADLAVERRRFGSGPMTPLPAAPSWPSPCLMRCRARAPCLRPYRRTRNGPEPSLARPASQPEQAGVEGLCSRCGRCASAHLWQCEPASPDPDRRMIPTRPRRGRPASGHRRLVPTRNPGLVRWGHSVAAGVAAGRRGSPARSPSAG